jgi:hypothetical protein
MEMILHYMYVVAISKTRAWEGATPFQLSMISYFNLQIIWLKVPLDHSRMLIPAPPPLAILPTVGNGRWHRNTREYASMYE